MPAILNIATYRFVAINDPAALQAVLLPRAQGLGLKGTILLAPEGINAFIAGAETAVRSFLASLDDDARFAGLSIKESWSDEVPFTRLKIKLKQEIVTFRQPGLNPVTNPAPAMTATELKRRLDAGEDIVLLDTRNDVEVAKGTFKNAVFWGNRNFTEFADVARVQVDALRNKTVVSFCTGGIRCEKAAPFLQSLGAENVFQLQGGILRYFEEVGRDHYDGDCFVFDERTAVDSTLSATR
ncbi:MAG: sulfurtransferase [Rhizobacter sp.]|nr:sulfurtransferase [Burkholderiales bacterium]